MKDDEITAVGVIAALIIILAMYLDTQYKTNKRLTALEKESFQTKTIAVDQY